MNSEWSLDVLYKGFDDPKFISDFEKVDELIANYDKLAHNAKNMDSKQVILDYIFANEEMDTLISDLFQFASLRSSANTKDAQAASFAGRLMNKLSATTSSNVILKRVIAEIDNLDEIIQSDPILKEYEYMLHCIRDDNKHMLDEKSEQIMSLYNISGGGAWGDLQSFLTSSVTVDYRDEKIGLSSVRNLAYDSDAQVRKDAYYAELAAYEKIKDSVAFALNSIKLQVINSSRLSGFASPLDESVYYARMTRETLDALLETMDEHMDIFRRYLKIKAKALGHENGMPWYDMFAPLTKGEGRKFTVEQARDYLVEIFKKFDNDLANMVQRAFDEAWIDFYPRDAKVGGAFCSGLESHGQSRILTNFDGTLGDVVTLAHELGHAFHNLNVEGHRPLNRGYSMPVAETASTFNENVVMEAAIDSAQSDEEKLALIESQLMDAAQVICDIYSRFLFESAVFANRENDFMFADKLCELMLDAQKKAYSDGLDHSYLHPYMWLCKGHYYSSGLSFYNFPYAFGGLFARGLYAKYREMGQDFVPVYEKLLNTTPTASVEDAAKVAGIDLTKKDFWEKSICSYEKLVDEFEVLAKRIYNF